MFYRDYLVLSEFTAALFEDSGWYKTNYSALLALHQHALQWGKGIVTWNTYLQIALLHFVPIGLGCSFLNEPCVNQIVFPYLCDEDVDGTICTFDHLSKVQYVATNINMMYLEFHRGIVLLSGLALMVVLLPLLLILQIIVNLNQLLEM